MGTITVNGFFGDTGRPAPVEVEAVFSGSAMNETLTVSYGAGNRVGIPFRQIERLAADVRAAAAKPGAADMIEMSAEIGGYLSGGGVNMKSGTVALWFRRSGQFEMLSLSFGDSGQLSLPFGPLAALAQRERRNFV